MLALFALFVLRYIYPAGVFELMCLQAVAAVLRCSIKKVFLKIFQNAQENTCVGVCYNPVTNLRPATLLKERLQRRCCPVNFAKFLNTLFCKTPLGDCICTEKHFTKLGKESKAVSRTLANI